MTHHRFPQAARVFLALVLSSSAAAKAQETDGGGRIGVAAPISGPSAILGAQVLAGARQAASQREGVVLVEADTACSAEGGRTAAVRFVAETVDIAIGFLCTEALEAARPALDAAGIPVIAAGVRAIRFTDARPSPGARLWRVAPRSDAAAKAIADVVVRRWRDVPFGLVDDGTVDGRGLSDAVRTLLEAEGLKPALLDAYRPAEEKQFGLVRRIDASGVTRLVVAGDRPDLSILLRDATDNGLSLEILGGESLLDEPGPVPLPAGVLAVAPQWRFEEVAGEDAAGEPETREGYFGPSLIAASIAADALAKGGRTGEALGAILDSTSFSTPLGTVRFDDKGDSDLDLFRVFRFDGANFVSETGG